jgi:hypothetical protein
MPNRVIPVVLVFFFNLIALPQLNAQTVTNLAVLKGLAPLTILRDSPEGRAAIAANFSVTGAIHGGYAPINLLPFEDQQQQALKDAFITSGNLAQLADGLGTTLGSAYVARSHYKDREHFTNLSQAVADLIAYTNATTRDDSNSAKLFFGNGTTDGKTAASKDALMILSTIGGMPGAFGKDYNRCALRGMATGESD